MKRLEERQGGMSVKSVVFFVGVIVFGSYAEAQYGAQNGEWPSYGGDLGSTKYSSLDQIDEDNFEDLDIVWRWKSIDGEFDLSRLETDYPNLQVPNDRSRIHISNLKATPLVVSGVLYVTTPLYQAAALDPATGETLWVYDPKSYTSGIPEMLLGFNNRGLAYWTDGEQERLLWATGDGYLIAVDAKSGEPITNFGQEGKVDLIAGIPRADRGPPINYSVSSAPIVVHDVVVVGSASSDQPQHKEAPPGYVRGFDVRTGKLLWTFHTIPQPGELGYDTWEPDAWEYMGDANVWTLMSADEERGYIYLPVGTATNNHYGGHRLGNNLFANSLVAVSVETGERVWHFQFVHHDLWDYDLPAAPNLVDITVDGKRIEAVAQVTKHGFTFVFDRATGEPVWPIEERPVPSSDVPGEQTSPTQPFPTKPPPFARQGVSADELIDFFPELRAEAVEILKRYRTGPLFTPPSLRGSAPGDTLGTLQFPGYIGGANWQGAALDPETGILYVPSRTYPSVPAMLVPDAGRANLRYVRGATISPTGPGGLPLFKPPYGLITAIDLNQGAILWQKANGAGSLTVRNDPLLKGLELPPLGSGVDTLLVTKTLLICGQVSPGERGGALLVARNKQTGDVVGTVPLPGRAIGSPMTYTVGDKQYLALTIRGSPPELIALSLPRVVPPVD